MVKGEGLGYEGGGMVKRDNIVMGRAHGNKGIVLL